MRNRRPIVGGVGHHYEPETGFTVIDVQETDEGPAPGTKVKPLVEEYEGRVFPYRGTETHGVDPLYDVPPMPDEWEGGMAPVNVDEGDKGPEKITPVRIVNQGSKEIQEWRAFRVFATGLPSILVGKFDARTKFQILNLSATRTIYVGGDMQVSRNQGYPVAPNTTFSIECDTEVWGISDDGSDVDCAVYVVYAVVVK